MSLSCSAVSQPIAETFKTIANSAVSFGKQVGTQCGRVIGYVTPKLAGVLAKIQTIQVPAFLAPVVRALKSEYGLSGVLLLTGIGFYAACRNSKSPLLKAAYLTATLACISLSAAVIMKPFGAIKA